MYGTLNLVLSRRNSGEVHVSVLEQELRSDRPDMFERMGSDLKRWLSIHSRRLRVSREVVSELGKPASAPMEPVVRIGKMYGLEKLKEGKKKGGKQGGSLPRKGGLEDMRRLLGGLLPGSSDTGEDEDELAPVGERHVIRGPGGATATVRLSPAELRRDAADRMVLLGHAVGQAVIPGAGGKKVFFKGWEERGKGRAGPEVRWAGGTPVGAPRGHGGEGGGGGLRGAEAVAKEGYLSVSDDGDDFSVPSASTRSFEGASMMKKACY